MPDKKSIFWRYNWPVFTWAFIILVLCGMPGDKIPEMTFLQWLKPDKIVHLFLFGVLSYLMLKGFYKQTTFNVLNKNAIVYALILSIAYGCLVEFLQSTIFIHRSGDIRDAIANALGALIGYWFYKRSFSKFKKPVI